MVWVWVFYWASIFAATHVPVPEGAPISIPGADKVVHFVLFGLLTYLGGLVWVRPNTRSQLRTAVLWACVYAVYGALDEWTQALVGRSTSIFDWLADFLGVLGGTALLLRRAARTKISGRREE